MHTGQPDNWNERYQTTLAGIDLPQGAEFYATPSHGYLKVDIRKHHALVSNYDYWYDADHVLLEEDCSLTMWLAEMNLIPTEPYILNMMKSIKREPAYK